jgi:hypothetical protein
MSSRKQEAGLGIPTSYFQYGPEEDHILRRLGGALIVIWDQIPKSKQDKLIAQACLMPDRETTTSLNEQIRIFIREKQEAM